MKNFNFSKLKNSNLFGWSVGVTLAAFAAMGMSFTPTGEDGSYQSPENDSILLNLGDTPNGPRRSHWHWTTTANCNTTPHYQSSVDYAETKVQTRGNGSATISTTETTNVTSATSASTNTTAGNTASISWNSGLSHSDKTSAQYTNDQIAAAHKKVFKLEATPINDNYYFYGWGTSTSESSVVSADNPYTITSDMGIGGYTESSSQPANYATNTYTETYYAFFKERLPANITLKVPTNGTIKYSYESYSNVTLSSETTITTKQDLTLIAVPDDDCRFYGWYTMSGSTENFISTSETYTRAYPDDITIYAKFVPNSQATFRIKGTDQYFYDLGQACAAAASSSSKIVYPIADGTVPAGNYTIPSGVTLLIPYEGTKLEKLTAPAYKYFSSGTPDAPTCYRKLILLEGANITCDGAICVAGQIASLGGGYFSGYPFGDCGVLDMSNGGHIELNNGSTLYAWGFVKGQDMDQGNNTVGVGSITANSGATVYEDFSGENRGGSACSDLVSNKSYKCFPYQGYAVQNIEVPVTYKYQSTLKVYTTLYIQGDIKKEFPLISSSGSLFLVQNNTSYVKKWYDPTTDLACYELSGSAKLDAINTTIYKTINSADYNLPISSNMHIILDNCTMTLANPVQILPDAVIEIKANSTANLSSNIFLYDVDDWQKGVATLYFASFKNLTSHKNRGDGTSKANLSDAKLIVDGILNVTGKIYSTSGGANICGNGGGKIVFSSSLPTATNIYQLWGAAGGTKTSTSITISSTLASDAYLEAVPVNAANLCNEDESYTKSVASTTFHNVNGRWFAAANKDENTSTHVYDHFIYISDGQPVSGSSGSTTDTKAVYAPDKTGLVAGMKWCNVSQDATCTNIYNATQSLNETAAADIRYTYPSSSWVQLLKTETPSVCEGSDNNLYAIDGCTVTSLGTVDENCLYTLDGVKKAIVNGQFVALAKNTEDEAWHNTAATTEYYISFAGCIWHPATKYPNEEKAYIVEGDDYIWYNNDWLLVENESGMFFDYNEQNVKRYYEYENGAWKIATPFVRVKDDIETRDFFKFDEAITVASGKKNTIITLLKDVPCTTMATYSAKNTTCTLDLNNHTVHGACATLLKIDASGTTFTITDNSDEKNGRLENIFAQNAVTYGINLTAGTLNVDTGTVYVENPAQYASKAATVNGVAVTALASCGARAVQVAAAQKLNLKKGSLEAYATRNAYGIVATGNTANTTQVTITGGKVYAEAPCGAYGISCTGKLNMSAGLVEAKLNDHLVDAAYAADNASNNLNKHQTCYAIIMNGYANKTASSCYYGTLTVTGGKIKASSDLVRSYTSNVYGIYMNVSVAGMENRNNASTSGTNSEQACSKGSIKNATIEVQNNGNYGYGIIVLGKYNSKDKSNTTIKIENSNVTVKAYNYAYGIYASGAINGTTGECSTSDVELTNNIVYAEAEKAAGAYATWVWASYTTIYKDKQANYYGEYAAGAKMTINSGTYTAKTKTTSAYATGTSLRAKSIYDPTSSTTWGPGEGKEALATLIINGGTFNAEATTNTARGVSSGGNTTIKDATFNVVAKTTTAYGLYAQSGKLTATNVIVNDTAKGRTSSSDNNAYAYGVMADISTIGSGNQAWTGYTCAGEIELNNCTINTVASTYANARGVMVNAGSVMMTRANFDKQKTSSSWSDATYNQYNSVFPVQVQGKDSIWVGIAGKVTVNGGTYTVRTKTTTAYGAFTNRALKYSYTKPNTILEEYQGTLEINNATFDVSTEGTTYAEGVRSYGQTTITGGSFTVQPKSTNAYGLRVYSGKTTVNGNPTFTVKATTTAYGIMAGGGEAPADKTGALYNGEVEVNGGTFNVETTSDKPAYGVYVYGNSRAITSTAAGYYAGNYACAGKATINDAVFNVKSKKTEAYGFVVNAIVNQSGASGYAAATASPQCFVNGGKYKVEGTSSLYMANSSATAENFQISGGYYTHNTNLDKYKVSPKKVLTLRPTNTYYQDPYNYRYVINEGGTVTWKNGDATLGSPEMYEKGETPSYSGATPTKAEDASYTYTHSGWTPTISAMNNSDVTYTATYNQTERKYSVSVAAGANGSVSPASVNNIGAATASSDITATPSTGYKFVNWTLPEGVTAASGYSATSNPIRIHATAASKTITANFEAKTYTVTLDNQEATIAGAASVTATYNAAMPSIAANLPEKTGYKFGGYWSDVNGGGTQYYNNNGTSAHVWDIDAASPKLYAQWSINKYDVTIATTPAEYGTVTASPIKEVPYNSAVTTNGNQITINGTTVTANPATATTEWLYSFSKWNDVPANITGTTTITAEFTRAKQTYQIKFVDEDGITNLGSYPQTLEYGSAVTAPADPEKASTSEWIYTFAGWSDGKGHVYQAGEIPSVTGVATYTATYSSSPNKVTIDFKNEDGVTSLGDYPKQITYDAAVTAPSEPIKDGNAQYSYTFAGWSDGNGHTYASDAIPNATVAATYTATFVQTVNEYTITWVDGNGETLKTEEVAYGATPSYDGETPTKTATAQYTYTFNNTWSPAIVAVTGEATYTAQFGSAVNEYTITWVDGDGNTIETDQNVKYGATPTYNGATPTKTADAQYTYTFNNTWSPAIVAVTGDVTYTAQFSNTVNEYTITWKDLYRDPQTIKTEKLAYGAQPAFKYEKQADDYYTYDVLGWTVEGAGSIEPIEIPTVTGDATYIASYRSIPKRLVVANDETETFDYNNSAITVQAGGKLNVARVPSTGDAPKTDELIIEATATASGEITTGAAILETTKAYFDLYGPFAARTWYAVAVPWQVEVTAYGEENGVFIKKGDNFVRQKMGTTFDLIYYDGAKRAMTGHTSECWRYLENDQIDEDKNYTMNPGIAYMIYLASGTEVIRFERKTGAPLLTETLSVEAYDENNGKNEDANWNGVANPATFKAYINAKAKDMVKDVLNVGQIYNGDEKTYSVINLDEKNLVVGQPVFIQAMEDNESVVAYADHEDAYQAPRRAKAYSEILRYEVDFAAEGSASADHIIIRTNEEKENDMYVVGQDLVKMGVSSVVPQMWIDRYDSRLCINTMAPVNESAAYPLSLFAPQAGEYTISSNATPDDNVVLYLTFDGRPLWNLTYAPYVANLEKGTTLHYGLLLVRRNVPTDIDAVQSGEHPAAQKILLNGQVYILRGNELYSISGQIVK